jgi:hypothetical protein
MADKKITELPISTTLDGTEIVPIVQGGVTSQATTQDIADLGGGTQNLQSVTDAGNTTTNDIQFDAGVGVLLDNTSRLREGTIDAGYGGAKGIAQICAVGYELKWESGSLYVMDGNGTHIRHTLYNFASVPSITEDINKGFLVGTRWSLDNGNVYVCTDNSIGAAVWVLEASDFTDAEKTKLSGIASGAEVNVNADWNAISGDAEILNKPTIPSAITKTSELFNDGDDGNPFISLNDLPSNLILYATNKASDVPTYVKLVSSITDIDYNTTAVDVSTGSITTTNQFISALITLPNVIVGNPGVLNITTIGNIRRTAGTGNAEFYFEVYKRVAAGTETLITTSGSTLPVFNGIYAEFSATALWNDGIFLATDRIVLKFYGTRISGGSNPTYDFQFGGSIPVRSLVPIPLTVSPTPLSELIINKQDSLAVDGTATKYPTVDAVNSRLVPSKVDGFVFSGSYMPCTIGYYTMAVGSAIMNFIIAQNILPRKTCTITSLSAYCSTGVAGGNIRLAIYSDLNGMPNNLLVDSGNIACISAGLKEAAITPFVLQGQTKYHICHQVSSNTILLRYNIITDRLYYQASNNLYVPNKLATFTFGAFPAIYPLASVLPTFDGFGYCTEIFLKAQ